jgi:putative transposase
VFVLWRGHFNSCGLINDIPLSQRTYTCECGYSEDRDINAALNLKDYTLGYRGINACGHDGSGFDENQSETVVEEAGISVCAHKSSHRK